MGSGIIRRSRRVGRREIPSHRGFGFKDLEVDAAGCERVTIHAQGGWFARYERMKTRRFEPGADELRVGWTWSCKDAGEVHDWV
jgi:hypothetical protein